MIFRDFVTFKKHLSSPGSTSSRCYLLSIADDYERAKAAKLVISYLLSDGASPLFFSGAELEMRDLYDALQSPSLFGGEAVVFVDDVEKIGKKDLQALSSQITELQFDGFLILGSRLKTSLLPIIEKSGVVFDLIDEKIWDKEKRIIEQMSRRVENGGKRLSSDAAPLLLERVGSDSALLDQEIDKLICFVGSRPTIERSDVFRITAASKTETLWKIAEELIWEGGQNTTTDSFYALLPALRSQLQMGLKITSLQSSGIPRGKWSEYLPKLWPKILEKRSAQAVKLGSFYFHKGLELLFEVEHLSRTGCTREQALFDLFRVKLASNVQR